MGKKLAPPLLSLSFIQVRDKDGCLRLEVSRIRRRSILRRQVCLEAGASGGYPWLPGLRRWTVGHRGKLRSNDAPAKGTLGGLLAGEFALNREIETQFLPVVCCNSVTLSGRELEQSLRLSRAFQPLAW
jgi:hypothetical protein